LAPCRGSDLPGGRCTEPRFAGVYSRCTTADGGQGLDPDGRWREEKKAFEHPVFSQVVALVYSMSLTMSAGVHFWMDPKTNQKNHSCEDSG